MLLTSYELELTHVSFCVTKHALLDGAEGKTTADELSAIDIHSWPGINDPVQPTNSTLKLYGVLAFESVMNQFNLATKSMSSPRLETNQVLNSLEQLYGHIIFWENDFVMLMSLGWKHTTFSCWCKCWKHRGG